jgi:lysine 2,3-aminomutase
MANRIRTPQQLLAAFPTLAGSPDVASVMAKYPMAITPYYASLIRSADCCDPIFQMCVPQAEELIDPPFLTPDPLEECRDMPVPGMVHRYPDRALVIATTMCSTYCRHCTRKRIAGTRETSITKRRLEQIATYLREHPQISDVIVSGGDPLTMSTEHLEMVLSSLRPSARPSTRTRARPLPRPAPRIDRLDSKSVLHVSVSVSVSANHIQSRQSRTQ